MLRCWAEKEVTRTIAKKIVTAGHSLHLKIGNLKRGADCDVAGGKKNVGEIASEIQQSKREDFNVD